MRQATLVALVLAMLAPACATRSGGVPRPFPGAPLPPQPTAGAPDPATISAGEPAARSEPPPPADRPATSAPGATPAPVPVPTLVSTALSLRGSPYRDGGSTPDGFDCSGFVQWVLSRHGTRVPREVKEQFRIGRAVEPREVRAGDLVFFETVSRGASHVGIVIDADTFVHAPSSRGVVRVERFTGLYWSQRFVGARRVLDAEPAAVAD